MSPGRPPHSQAQALAIFKRALTAEGRVFPSGHYRKAMADPEDPFDDQDVLRLRTTGVIRRPPEFDVKHGEWKYRVEGTDCEGRPFAVIFVPLDERSIKLVTGFHE